MVAQFNIFKPPDLIQFQVAADTRQKESLPTDHKEYQKKVKNTIAPLKKQFLFRKSCEN